jgi:hypothetical protein
MPRNLTLAQLLGYERFHCKEESKLTYIRLNTQTPCPPRGAVPVNSGRTWEFFHSVPSGPNFGNGCDCPGYVALFMPCAASGVQHDNMLRKGGGFCALWQNDFAVSPVFHNLSGHP